MKHWIVRSLLILFLLALLATPAVASNADRGFRLPPPRIVNRVLDLLDEEIALTGEAGENAWESEVFDTSQFNRIGLRFASEVEGGSISCYVAWRFSREDEFLDGIPIVTYSPLVQPLYRPDGVPDLYVRQRYAVYMPQLDFAAVNGLQARVRCTLFDVRVVYQQIGDDPGLVEPDPTDPIPMSASLTDVKVLLRRE